MNELRLIACFQTVFPDLPEASILSATQVPAVDSFPSILKYIDQQRVS